MHSLHFHSTIIESKGKLGEMTGQQHPLFAVVKDACEKAIKDMLHVSVVSPRRLLTAFEAAEYLSLSPREIYAMLATRQLSGVKHGRRVMVDILDLIEWIESHKAA